MEINSIVQLISTIGFPIAMCLVLCKYIQTTQKELISKMGDISSSISLLVSLVGQEEKKNDHK